MMGVVGFMDAGVYEVIAVVVSFTIGVFASSRYYKRIKIGIDEITDCLNVIEQALEDDRITKEEVKAIFKECFNDLKR